MWAGSMLLTLNTVVVDLVNGYQHVSANTIEVMMLFTVEVGLAGFISNIIQFSMDQLPDASTEEIVSYIRWLTWTTFSSFATLNYTLFCTGKKYELIGLLVVSASLTLLVCLDFLFNKHLIKEPASENPFRLVFNVVRYAIKTKQPRCRSAFTYCENDLPSRIDFGKSKYGGPFTTEQVEDVKTFLRLLIVVVVSGALPGPFVFLEYVQSKLTNQFLDYKEVIGGCYTAKDLSFMYFACGLVSVPLYDLVIQPAFYKCIPSLSSHWKIFFGVILLLLQVLILMSIDLISNQVYSARENRTSQCLFHDRTGIFKDVLDYRWLSLPEICNSISSLFVIIGIIEFLCAQVPYSMKGIFLGILITIVNFFFALGTAVFVPFTLELPIWNKGALSCGFWYFFSESIIVGVGLVLSMLVIKWYKERKRQDVLPNEQTFAERYYSS